MGHCELCSKNQSRYTCPRCNIHYCSAQCYAGPLHSSCSEGFYKEQVQQQLHNHRAPPDSREKMKQMLRRLEEDDAVAAFSSGCETGELQQEENEELDSDDDDDLETRLRGIDLDDSDKVWERLTEDERRQFRELVQTGDVTAVLPPFVPWWQPADGAAGGGPAIIELEDAEARSFKRSQTKSNVSSNSENFPMSSKRCEEQSKNCAINQTSESATGTETCSENSLWFPANLDLNVGGLTPNDESNLSAAAHSSSKSSECDDSLPNLMGASPSKCDESSCDPRDSSKIVKSNILQSRCSSCSAKSDTSRCSNCLSSTSSSCKPSSSSTIAALSQPLQNPSSTSRGTDKKSQLKNKRNELVDAFPCVPVALKAKYPNCPPLPRVKILSNLISTTPSPSLRYSLLNVMVGYAWLMRLFHGDLMDRSREAAEGLLRLCGCLGAGQAYSSCQEAAASVTMRALQHEWLCPTPEMAEAAAADATLLLTRPRELPGYFLIAALSHLKDLVRTAAKGEDRPNEGSFACSVVGAQSAVDVTLATPVALRATAHKLDFFMAYSVAHRTELLDFFAG